MNDPGMAGCETHELFAMSFTLMTGVSVLCVGRIMGTLVTGASEGWPCSPTRNANDGLFQVLVRSIIIN